MCGHNRDDEDFNEDENNRNNNDDEEKKEESNESDNENEFSINLPVPSHITESAKNLQSLINEQLKLYYNTKDIFQPVIEKMSEVKQITKPFQEMVEKLSKLIEPLKNIDWEKLADYASEKLEETNDLILRFEKDLWCIDIDLLDYFSDKDITAEKIETYVENNLDDYVETMIEEPMFSLHTTLLTETLEAYKNGHYRLCSFSLLSIFEYIISSWFKGNIKVGEVLLHENPHVYRLYNRIEKISKKDEEQKEFFRLFVQTIIRIYLNIFEKEHEVGSKKLNRHSIVHGIHDYNTIDKTDILKLFQLLKSCFILREISIDDIST